MNALTLWWFPTVGLLLASSPLHAVPVHQWSQGFGGGVGSSVTVDRSGNVFVTGDFRGAVDFGGGLLTSAGENDIFVVKFDASGTHRWSESFGDAGHQSGLSVAVDASGNIVVTGQVSSGSVDFGGGPLTSSGDDIFVAKFDVDGNHLWSRSFGGAGSVWGSSVAADGSSNIVVTGGLRGAVDFEGEVLVSADGLNGGTDIFVAKFDVDGNHLRSQRFGDGDWQSGHSVAADGSGNVVLTGSLEGTADFGGGPLTSAGGADIFVAKFDANGNHLWSQRFGDGDGQVGRSVSVDSSGNVLITGGFIGTVDLGGGPMTSAGRGDIFLAKFDASENHIWSRRFGDGDSQEGYSVAMDGTGNVFVTGYFKGAVDFGGGPLVCTCVDTVFGGYDIFLAQFDADGTHLWSQHFGDGDGQVGRSVAAQGSGNVFVTGYFRGAVDFGGGPLTSAGTNDIFVAKFMETPNPVLITSFEATTCEGAVEIRWDVWSDEALESFTLYRSDDARPLAIVIAKGTFVHATRSYIDASVEPGRTYQYELLIYTQDGDDVRSPVATVTVPRFEATLGQNFPNPFKPATTIEYTLSERSSTVLGIYDAAGRLVVRLDQGVREAGTHRAAWDGRDAGGRTIGSGVYFYRLEGAPRVAPKKMVLVR